MKPPKIRLNGVDLESVTTVERLQRESSSRRSIGRRFVDADSSSSFGALGPAAPDPPPSTAPAARSSCTTRAITTTNRASPSANRTTGSTLSSPTAAKSSGYTSRNTHSDSIGLPRQAVQPVGERLLLTLHPLTAAQLYFDGVLPADRATPIQLRVGREKTTIWRIVSLESLQNRHYEYVVVFTLRPSG